MKIFIITFLLAGFSVMGNAAVSTVPSQEEHPELFSTGNCWFSELLLHGYTDQGLDSLVAVNGKWVDSRDFIMGITASGPSTVLAMNLGPEFHTLDPDITNFLRSPRMVVYANEKEIGVSMGSWDVNPANARLEDPNYMPKILAAIKETGAPKPPTTVYGNIVTYNTEMIQNIGVGSTTVESYTGEAGGSGVSLLGTYLMSGAITGFSAQAYEDRVGVPNSTLIVGFDIIGPKVAAGKPLPTKTVFIECQSSTLPVTIPQHLPHPVIRVYDSKDNLLATNGGWSSVVTVSAYATTHGYHIRKITTADCKTVGATQPAGVDCALVITANPGGYTVVVTDGTSQPGNSLTRIINGDKLPM